MNKLSLSLFIHAQNATQTTAQKTVDRVKNQEGATTVEYIMILGIMALIVAALFLADGGIRDGIMSLGRKIVNTLTGAGNDQKI